MRRYLKCKNARYRKQQNAKNDCAVIAVSIICRTTYKNAFLACERNGRLPKRGMMTSNIIATIAMLGFKLEPVKKLVQPNGSRYTAKTVGSKLVRGYYLAITHDHAFAVVNGDVEDWTANRKNVVTAAYKIIRPRV